MFPRRRAAVLPHPAPTREFIAPYKRTAPSISGVRIHSPRPPRRREQKVAIRHQPGPGVPPSQAIPIFLPAPAAAVAAIWWSSSARATRCRKRSWSNTTARVVWINAATGPASPWTRRRGFAPSTSAGRGPAGSSNAGTRCAGGFWAVRRQHLHELDRRTGAASPAPTPASGFAAGPDRQSADGVGRGFRLSTGLFDSRVRPPLRHRRNIFDRRPPGSGASSLQPGYKPALNGPLGVVLLLGLVGRCWFRR